MNFSLRSHKPELLDQPDIPAADISRNLYELQLINRWLGGHAITRKGFRLLAAGLSKISLCELGCGGGDNLLTIQKTAGEKIILNCTGIDRNPDCIRVARSACWNKGPQFILSDYRAVVFEEKPDIVFSSLFCHHFTEEQLVDMFRWMKSQTRTGFFINDLHRHPLAYYAIRMLTTLFSRSYLVKNDAPLSVLRGFKKNDLVAILDKAGIREYSIRWQWAFRWLIIVPS
jgi:ubiquinone/menaquinone biosynthesis C-methylase UbiE